MVIITHEDIIFLTKRLQEEPAYIYPVPADPVRHPADTVLSSLHILFNDGAFYTLSVTHPDAPRFSLDLHRSHKLITLYHKELRHLTNATNIIDLASILQLQYQEIPVYRDYYTPLIRQIKNQFKIKNLHQSVPLSSWADTAETFLHRCKTLYQQYQSIEQDAAFQFVNQITIPTLSAIEAAGIHTTNGLVYSDYNIYTSTGRPSNAFGGINFAALNKNDGTREKFTSRFGELGTLVQFDYEAFHLRLAANLIKYQLPPTSVHTFLAEQYYKTSDITPEMYEQSKTRTFALMYGQTDDDGGVEFFRKLKDYSSELWRQYCDRSYVVSGTGRRIAVPTPTKNKVFNYWMQLTETETAIARIHDACTLLVPRQSKVVLYTYDAILLDVHNDELEYMSTIARLLSIGGYPVRQYRGSNYNNLILNKI
jgi:hypothetical protein